MTGDDLYSNLSGETNKFGTKINGEEVYFVNFSALAGLYLEGRTLYYNKDVDVGLTFAKDAKAVVSQKVNDDRTETEYASVKEAYGVLSDAYETDDGILHFDGHIAAVLDSKGVAQWVVFYDDHEVTTGTDPDYGNNNQVKKLTFVDSSNNIYATTNDTSVKVPNCKIVLEQLQANGYVTVGTFTTGDNGAVKLPVVPGTYRATCGDIQLVFTNT